MLYNFLNFPAGVVPVSTVTEADEEELKLYRGCCNDPWDRKLKQVCDTESGGAETADGCSSNSFIEIRGSYMRPSKKPTTLLYIPFTNPFSPKPQKP